MCALGKVSVTCMNTWISLLNIIKESDANDVVMEGINVRNLSVRDQNMPMNLMIGRNVLYFGIHDRHVRMERVVQLSLF